MVSRKGAFQVSIGFIIAIVFAVVMLSLSLNWLTGTIGGITDLSDTLHQQASLKLLESFRERGTNFEIWPPQYDVAPATKLSVTAGITNNAQDGESHNFVVGVSLPSVPKGLEAQKQTILENWVEWAKPAKRIAPNANDDIPIIIMIPENAKHGNYIFRITACSDVEGSSVGTAEGCTPTSNNVWGGSSRDFVLTVK